MDEWASSGFRKWQKKMSRLNKRSRNVCLLARFWLWHKNVENGDSQLTQAAALSVLNGGENVQKFKM